MPKPKTQPSTPDRQVWFDRNCAPLELHYTLCLTEDAYRAAFKSTGCTDIIGPWLHKFPGAMCRPIFGENKELHVLVSMGLDGTEDPIQVAALLVHEAVHVFQYHIEQIGEDKPGQEYEAYSIQHIAANLMTAYANRKS